MTFDNNKLVNAESILTTFVITSARSTKTLVKSSSSSSTPVK